MRFLVKVDFDGSCKVVVDANSSEEAVEKAEDIVVKNFLDFSPNCSSNGTLVKEYKEEEDADRWLLSLSEK